LYTCNKDGVGAFGMICHFDSSARGTDLNLQTCLLKLQRSIEENVCSRDKYLTVSIERSSWHRKYLHVRE
jgi:hypothetical protein